MFLAESRTAVPTSEVMLYEKLTQIGVWLFAADLGGPCKTPGTCTLSGLGLGSGGV